MKCVTRKHKKMSGILKALAHPVRLRMAEGLSGCECNVDKMVRRLGLPQSTVSQHLTILRNAGILAVRKDGVKACYCVNDPRIKKLLRVIRREL